MVLINYATKEIVAKVVYYGPGLCGKTTNLQYIYTRLNPKKRGKLISLATEADRTLFFDFLPVELGLVQGFKVRFQLYTVPGQVFYSATRKLVLKGADALVFVADSQADVLNKNIESIDDMKQNLLENDLDPAAIPIVFQYNKRDLDNTVDVWLLEKKLNYRQAPSFEAVAVGGTGVMETFMGITNLLIKDLKRRHSMMDTETLKELPPDIFAQKVEKPAEPEEEIPIEAVLEIGSGYRHGEDNDVLPGELLDQVENISLADSVQAEAFFDNVRKGAPTEEARQKAENIVPAAQPNVEDIGEVLYELELESEPSRQATEIEPSPEKPETAPVDEKAEGFLGLDMTSPEMMEPDRIAASEPFVYTASVPEAAPVMSAAPAARADVDLSSINEALARVEEEIASLKKSVNGLKIPDNSKVVDDGALISRIEGLENLFKASLEGQDRLLLSILESVRETKRANAEAYEKLEDGLKYIVDKIREEPGNARKKWF
jgi:hypothetical protein